MSDIKPVLPGEILQEEFIKPLKISVYKLSKDIGVSQSRISDIINGKRGITADIAMRLALYFGTSPQFWMNIQNKYDFDTLNI